MTKKSIFLIVFFASIFTVLIIAVILLQKDTPQTNEQPKQIEDKQEDPPAIDPKLLPASGEVTYTTSEQFEDYSIEILAENLGQVTRIRLTPDNEVMLVATLQENIYAFVKENGSFTMQDEPFFSLQTNLPGFPPQENGLTGMTLGADFEQSGDIFLSYTAKETENSDALKNRITRITFEQSENGVFGKDPQLIFEGNEDSASAHQIQGGVGVMIEEKPHLMFLIGEAFHPEAANDLDRDLGKIMLIQRDGSDPLGIRPYPQNPRIQAIGVRNAYDIALDPFDTEKRFAFADVGPNHNDRFVYGKILDLDNNVADEINFLWDGSEEPLLTDIEDPNIGSNPNMVLHRWDPTETALDIEFFGGDWGSIPKRQSNESYVFVSLFGKTGLTENTPGKKIVLGHITDLNGQPQIVFDDFITRSLNGEGKLGHPLGIAFDDEDQVLYFGDILEGRIYKVSLDNTF